MGDGSGDQRARNQASWGVIAREWGRIGVTGFGGPPAHIALLRALCVEKRGWLQPEEFEDGIAATSLLPGPTSTQLAIFCAWRLRGWRGALLGGACFILPGLVVIIALAALFLARSAPRWVLGVAAGAGAGVPAVAVSAALGFLPASWRRVRGERSRQIRWGAYLVAGVLSAALAGQYLVFVLLACGFVEAGAHRRGLSSQDPGPRQDPGPSPDPGPRLGGGLRWRLGPRRAVSRGARLQGVFPLAVAAPVAGGLAALVWVALKVGALSFGGGFVIIPLMQHDAVSSYHWMTSAQFLNAVALGQVTPGPVVLTVAVVGYAAGRVPGALLAAAVAFAPSFVFVIAGAPHFDRLRRSSLAQAFLTGAGACAIGGIAGAAVPLAIGLVHLWQIAVTALAAGWLWGLRKGVVSALIGCGALGVIAALAHAPVS